MTDMKSQAAEGELMTADEAEVRAILEARYPNDRRLQRAMIRLRELRPDGRYSAMRDTADPAFQRIVPEAPGLAGGATQSGTEVLDGAPPEGYTSPGKTAPAQPVALKVEPLVTTTSATAGRVAPTSKSAGKPAPRGK